MAKTMILRQGIARTIGLFVFAAGLIVACSHSGSSEPTVTAPAAAPTSAAAEPTAAPTSTASQGLNGAHVSVLGLWSGPEFDSFVAVKSAWEEETGGIVDWEGSQDLPGALDSRMQAGNPPDIAILPNLAMMQQLAGEGKLVPLDSVLDMKQVSKDYAPAWIDLGSYDGKLYGIFYKVSNKSTVWYNPNAFAAADYEVPETWSDMIALADKMVADGHAPFSVVAPRSPAAGWALTDWISEIVLNSCGPDLYDRWIAAEIPWTDACIKKSFDMFVEIVQTKGYVLGGTQGILSTGDADGADPLYTEPPTAYMYYLASFAQAFITGKFPDLEPGRDYNFFMFPTIEPRYQRAVTVGADVPVLVGDSPAARSFMGYLAGAQAQEAWIELGGFTSVNRSVSPDTYLDPVARAVAEELTGAEISRFSAGDLLPASLQRSWWKGMLDLVEDPSKVDSILDSLTGIAERAG